MKTASWVLLALVSFLIALGSFGSMGVAYLSEPSQDVIVGSTSLQDLALEDSVATALRGRRGTAAALGLAFATLLFFVVVGPYRAGARWAWCAILCSMLVFALMTALRIVTLGTWLGATIPMILFGIVVVGLLLDAKRFTQPSA